MNTSSIDHAPLLKEGNARDYVFVLEDLEPAFPKWQLEEITKDWNEGAELDFIAKKHKRHIDEVFLALFHQARQRGKKIKRPFAYRM